MKQQISSQTKQWKRSNPQSHLSYREVNTLILNKKKAIFPCETGGYNPNQDTPHQLPRHQQTAPPQDRPPQTEWPSREDWRKDLSSVPLWRGGPNTRTLPAVLLIPPASQAADMAHLCVPQNQVLGVCRGFVPDIQVCGTHGRENLIKVTITSNAEEELPSDNRTLAGS